MLRIVAYALLRYWIRGVYKKHAVLVSIAAAGHSAPIVSSIYFGPSDSVWHVEIGDDGIRIWTYTARCELIQLQMEYSLKYVLSEPFRTAWMRFASATRWANARQARAAILAFQEHNRDPTRLIPES